MYLHQNKYYSSFMSIMDHPQGISDDLQVLTIRSGSSGDGGHVSMYLEKTEPTAPGCFSTQMLDLTAMEGHDEPIIKIEHVQLWNSNGILSIDKLDKKRGPSELIKTHHSCYKINSIQSQKIIAAAERFRKKVREGRYTYYQEGGIKARLATRPGTRGVNCGDFVIKILKEAGIAMLGYKYKSTPYRVASPHQ